jgi:membrane-associated phospholipid phosphatase
MNIWHTITFLGDSSLTVPGACILALWLAANRMWLDMLRWLFAFGAAMMIVVVSKLLFMGWNISPPLLNFTGVSGHSASAAALYLAAATLFSAGRTARARMLALGVTLAAVIAVGMSRIMIKVHSGSEVTCGLLLGAAAAWWFGRALAQEGDDLRARYLPLVLASLLFLGANGQPAPTNGLLMQLAQTLSGHDYVYTRSIPL